MKPTNELIVHFLAELEHPVRPLTKQEESFFMSVSDQYEREGRLSERQFEVLERIYAERTA